MKEPTIRVSKWLGDIPVEACCSVCPGVVFKAKGSGHRPNREEYQKSIQAQFDVRRHTLKNNGRQRERSDISRAGVRNILKVASHARVSETLSAHRCSGYVRLNLKAAA